MSRSVPVVEAGGARIPALGLGTWQLSGDACRRSVGEALDLGYRHVDTAAMYGNEKEVGRAIRDSGLPRGEVFLTTKVWSSDIDAGDLQRSAEASLSRLGLEEVDLLLIHWPNRSIPLSRSIPALCDARRRGLARAIGVSNFPVPLLEEATRIATAEGERLAANQCEYHPRLDQSQVLAACRRHGLAFTAYSPLGRGRLASDPAIQRIARETGRSASQVLLRWLVQQDGVAAIPKAGSRTHLAENLAIFDFTLSDAQMDAIFALARPEGRMVDMAGGPDWDA